VIPNGRREKAKLLGHHRLNSVVCYGWLLDDAVVLAGAPVDLANIDSELGHFSFYSIHYVSGFFNGRDEFVAVDECSVDE
jgi:hypothetical protein